MPSCADDLPRAAAPRAPRAVNYAHISHMRNIIIDTEQTNGGTMGRVSICRDNPVEYGAVGKYVCIFSLSLPPPPQERGKGKGPVESEKLLTMMELSANCSSTQESYRVSI